MRHGREFCSRLRRIGSGPGFRQRLAQGTQILPQCRVQPLIQKPVETLSPLPGLRLLQGADIGQPILGPYRNRRIAAADQDEVRQQAGCPPGPVIERMDVHQAAMRSESHLWRVGGLARRRDRPSAKALPPAAGKCGARSRFGRNAAGRHSARRCPIVSAERQGNAGCGCRVP